MSKTDGVFYKTDSRQRKSICLMEGLKMGKSGVKVAGLTVYCCSDATYLGL